MAKMAFIRAVMPKRMRQPINTQNGYTAYASRLGRFRKIKYTANGMPAAKNKSIIIAP